MELYADHVALYERTKDEVGNLGFSFRDYGSERELLATETENGQGEPEVKRCFTPRAGLYAAADCRPAQYLTKQGVENPKVTNGITLCSTTPHIHFMQMIHFMQIIHAA